jgi:hypothetical protein
MAPMERRELLLLGVGTLAAAVAAGLALGLGGGSLDAPAVPPVAPATGPKDGAGTIRRGLPPLRLGPDVPEPAARLVVEAWGKVEHGTPPEAVAALGTLSPLGAGSPLSRCSPAVLEALAPGLEVLITGTDDGVSAAAMRCAAFLSRAGADAGRAALARTGLVRRAFALQASSGSPALRRSAAQLLGFAGGAEAVGWLAILVEKAPEPEVRVAAVEGLAEAFGVDRRLSLEAVEAVKRAAGPGAPAPLRAACMAAFARAWEAFRPYDVGPLAAAALRDGDHALRMAAASFFDDHPLEAQAGDLVRALDAEGDPRIVARLADALAVLRTPSAREPAEKRRRETKDPEAIKALERLLRALGAAPPPAPPPEK